MTEFYLLPAPKKEGADLMQTKRINVTDDKDNYYVQQAREFYELVYEGIDFSKEKLKLAMFNGDFKKNLMVNSIDNLVDIALSYSHKANVYVEMPSVKANAENGTKENISKRYCLFFDFDKKDNPDLSINEIQARFNKLGLWYHCLVDSGNGFHCYTFIEPTTNVELCDSVQKKLGEKLGADLKALCTTQLARFINTFNVKDSNNHKPVNIIHCYSKDTIRRYDINKLWNSKCNDTFTVTDSEGNTKTLVLSGDMPPCVSNALKEGSKTGRREYDLYNIIIYYKGQGYNISQIKYQVNIWNELNSDKLEESRINYLVEYIFNNCKFYNCKECENKCKRYVLSDFDRAKYEESIITLADSVVKQRRGGKEMFKLTGNELFIYNVLLNNTEFKCTIELILERITNRKTKTCVMNKDTVRRVLKALEEKNIIEVVKGNKRQGIADSYNLKRKNLTDNNSFKVSYFINILVIKGDISTTDLKVYMSMLYLHHKSKTKGNIFTVTQETLADFTGIDQSNVSKHLNSLWENHVLDRITHTCENKNMFYYEYKLNV